MMKPVPEFNDDPYWSPPHPDIILESQSAEVGWEADQDSGGQKVWHSPLPDSISTDLQANVEWFSTWGLVGQLACWYFPQGWWAPTPNIKAVLVSHTTEEEEEEYKDISFTASNMDQVLVPRTTEEEEKEEYKSLATSTMESPEFLPSKLDTDRLLLLLDRYEEDAKIVQNLK